MGPHASDTAAVLDSFRRIVQALRESSRRAEREVGLTGAQLFVLQKLTAAPAGSINELAARTQTHQSSVSAVAARLVRRGLVQRVRDAGDARRLGLALTPRGRRIAARTPDTAQHRLIRGVDRLPPGRRKLLASCLADLAREVYAVRRRPAMFFENAPAGRLRERGRARYA
jgi:DNA-binding MarR family transcriptional regulator